MLQGGKKKLGPVNFVNGQMCEQNLFRNQKLQDLKR